MLHCRIRLIELILKKGGYLKKAMLTLNVRYRDAPASPSDTRSSLEEIAGSGSLVPAPQFAY